MKLNSQIFKETLFKEPYLVKNKNDMVQCVLNYHKILSYVPLKHEEN